MIRVRIADTETIDLSLPCQACEGSGELICRACGGTGESKASRAYICCVCGGDGAVRCVECQE